MKKILAHTLLLCLFFQTSNVSAQLNILFVDDTDDTFGNAGLFISAIESLGYSRTIYDAARLGSSPSDSLMSTFDLVIWYTSTDGAALQLWNGTESDNPELKQYLDGGGNLWLVGLDFLFDRYLTPGPTTFTEGDFVYDYLGISSYDVQSFGNDGNIGVPRLIPDSSSPVMGLDTVRWVFDALNWVDGVTPRAEAAAVYRMDGDNYVFSDRICATYFEKENADVLTYLFDVVLATDFDAVKAVVEPALLFFSDVIAANAEPAAPVRQLVVFPNPADHELSINFELDRAATVGAQLLNVQGGLVKTMLPRQSLGAGSVVFSGLPVQEVPAGMYFLQLVVDGVNTLRRVVIH